MKAFAWSGFVIALAWTAVAWAQSTPARPPSIVVMPDWLKKPTPADMAAVWPAEATKQGVSSGKAKIRCVVDDAGLLQNCAVTEETPSGAGFGSAALKLASAMLMKPKTVDGRAVGGAVVTIPIAFTMTQPVKIPGFDTPPDWLQQPTLEEIWLVWPRKAASLGLSGTGTIRCVVNLQGLLQACTVASESPAGYGFGEAAVQLAPTFLMKPATRNGQPVESEVTIPVAFNTANGADLILPKALVVGTPAWAKTPSVAQILGQIDKKVGDKFADGKIVFLCSLNKTTGKLSNCKLANASPGMTQFRSVANSLVSGFEAEPKQLAEVRAWLGPTETEAKVILPFAFPDMASPAWSQRYVTHVLWTRPFGVAPDRPAFPDAAAKAGLKAGSAMIDCLIGADGGLSQCRVVSESAPGVGFGDTAKAIAEASHTNPWNDDGLPTDGARVLLPIQMAQGQPASIPATPQHGARP